MAKITALPRLTAQEATGRELVPVVHGNITKGVAVADVVAPAAQPYIDAAKLIKDQAADLVLPQNIFVDIPLADAEAQVSVGTTFKLVETSPGVGDVRRRTAPLGSIHLYYEVTGEALRFNDNQRGSGLVGAPVAGTVYDRLQWVTPEAYAFGAPVGDGTTRTLAGFYDTLEAAQAVYPFATALSQSVDWAAIQSAVNSGFLVRARPGAIYITTDEIVPVPGKSLMIQGWSWGTAESIIIAAPDFRGFMLRPYTGYDIRDLKVLGNGKDGCYLIGSLEDSSAGGGRIERVYIGNADIGIYFGDKWEHPWGLYYNDIIGVSFRTGGICLGGVTGAASSGESAWSMPNININGNPSGPGISATGIVVTANSPDATHDLISWDNTVTPLYGWCVMRSADGATNWEIPPNWTSHQYTAGTFSAQKAAGETWSYAVVRMTHGLHIRRGKAISMGVVQAEYFGVGMFYGEGFSASIEEFYFEGRNRNPPLPAYAGVVASNAALSVGGGWVERSGYGIISFGNADVNTMGGKMRMNTCRWGTVGLGGATAQSILHGILEASNGTPSGIVALAGTAFGFLRAGYEKNGAAGTLTHYVDGLAGCSREVRYRGVTKARQYTNAAGEGVTSSDRGAFANPSKVLTPLLSNVAQVTAITPGQASAFMTISGLANNSPAALHFHYAIRLNGTGALRQGMSGTLEVSLIETAGGGITAGATPNPTAKAIQNSLIPNEPQFTATIGANGVVTVFCNVATTMVSPTATIALTYLSHIGSNTALAVTQL